MLHVDQIRDLFAALNDELATREVIGDVGIVGGAVMCLVFGARESTKDVDAILRPTQEVRAAAHAVARSRGLPDDWLNDAAKGFILTAPPQRTVLELSHLRVWSPTADYMLAMKCVSARFDSHDADDVAFLIAHLQLADAHAVFDIIRRYYPDQRVPAKSRFLVEELLG